MSTKKIKSIRFELGINGRGIVNFDGGSKSELMKQYDSVNKADYDNKNVKVAKKVYTEDDFKIKISAECLRKSIYGEYMDYVTPEIAYSKTVLSSAIGTQYMLTRGYAFMCNEGYAVTRDSALTISDAIQTNDAKVVMDFCTASGQRNNTSVYGVERVGDITYLSKGAISLKKLQFISTDPRYSRMAVPHDWTEESSIYMTALKANIPNFNPKVGYFLSKGSVNNFGRYAESGVRINNEAIIDIVKCILTDIRSINISRATSYAEAVSLRIKLISDTINDNLSEEWIELKTIEDINNLSFEIEDFYNEFQEADVMKVRSEIDGAMGAAKNNKGTGDKKTTKAKKVTKKEESK